MLALYEMIENERNEIYSTGIKEGKVKGKDLLASKNFVPL